MKRLVLALALVLVAGCAAGPRIDRSYSSPGHRDRIRFLVIHYTHANFERTMQIMAGEDSSYHYVIRENPPTIYQLVDESRAAYHAGNSSWRGYTQLNESSVGVSLVNGGSGATNGGDRPTGWVPYPEAQLEVAIELIKDIVKRHKIRPESIVGHGEIAPQRKVDPGPLFPWKRLADAGLIKWPDPAKVAERLPGYQGTLPDVEWFQAMLARHGYAVPLHGELDKTTHNVVRVFQMRYRPAKFDGEPDAETAAILDALINP
jgi:N-acetylmuramoyl-L-alanine amidase